MKKILAVLATAFTLALVLTGCNGPGTYPLDGAYADGSVVRDCEPTAPPGESPVYNTVTLRYDHLNGPDLIADVLFYQGSTVVSSAMGVPLVRKFDVTVEDPFAAGQARVEVRVKDSTNFPSTTLLETLSVDFNACPPPG